MLNESNGLKEAWLIKNWKKTQEKSSALQSKAQMSTKFAAYQKNTRNGIFKRHKIQKLAVSSYRIRKNTTSQFESDGWRSQKSSTLASIKIRSQIARQRNILTFNWSNLSEINTLKTQEQKRIKINFPPILKCWVDESPHIADQTSDWQGETMYKSTKLQD